jgi:hypothetical protein
MSVIGEFSVPASALTMHGTLAAAPETVVEIERVVAHRSGTLTPYFWTRGGDRAAFEEGLADDPSVLETTRLDALEGGTLYRAAWPADIESIGQAYLRTGATILEATGSAETWELRLRFDDHEHVSTFHDYCEDHGVPYEVNRIYNPTSPKGAGSTASLRNSTRRSLRRCSPGSTTCLPRPLRRTSPTGSTSVSRPSRSGSDGDTATSSEAC